VVAPLVAVVNAYETAPLPQNEGDVVILLCAGLTNPEIAKELGATEVFVTGVVSRMLCRLELRKRVQLAARANRTNVPRTATCETTAGQSAPVLISPVG
jgi:DNA-binding NarL/FixJ family response regulator